MKKILIIAAVTVALICTAALGACVETDKEYYNNISAYSFWDNEGGQAIAQYKFYDVVDSYMSEGTIRDGVCYGPDGKVRKVLFIGWDGTRADAMLNLFYDSKETNGYNYETANYSGLHKLKAQGGLYLAYAGGEKGKESEQEPSTCPGWTSELTGGWHMKHGVKTNNDTKSGADTFVLKYAKLGLNTSLAFDWGTYFDLTIRDEIAYKLANPSLPVVYCDPDRSAAASNADILKNEGLESEDDILAQSLELYNAVACDEIHEYAEYDIAMRDYLLNRIEEGDDIVTGIFHSPDTNGHNYGFSNDNGKYVNSVRNADNYVNDILLQLERREAEHNEDWLVIVTADHGGSGQGHGRQVYEHRNIWVACNQKLDSYFGSGYDGFKEA